MRAYTLLLPLLATLNEAASNPDNQQCSVLLNGTSCTTRPVLKSSAPANAECGAQGIASHQTVLQTCLTGVADDCSTLCKARAKCGSFSFNVLNGRCNTFSAPVSGTNFVADNKGPLFFDSSCFASGCGTPTTTTSSSSTSTTSPSGTATDCTGPIVANGGFELPGSNDIIGRYQADSWTFYYKNGDSGSKSTKNCIRGAGNAYQGNYTLTCPGTPKTGGGAQVFQTLSCVYNSSAPSNVTLQFGYVATLAHTNPSLPTRLPALNVYMGDTGVGGATACHNDPKRCVYDGLPHYQKLSFPEPIFGGPSDQQVVLLIQPEIPATGNVSTIFAFYDSIAVVQ